MTSSDRNSMSMIRSSKNGSFSDREEIRRRLALESDGDECSANIKATFRQTFYTKRHHNQSNLQICFLNESPQEFYANRIFDSEKEENDEKNVHRKRIIASDLSSKKNNFQKDEINKSDSFELCLFEHKLLDPLDFPTYHSLIYTEAKAALGRAKEIARSQKLLENKKCHDSLNELLNILEEEKCEDRKISWLKLRKMSIAKLQILVNHLHSQIEDLNEQLVKLLFEKDELLMEQDSLLVDIDDETIFLLRKYRKLKSQAEIKC